jgi:hypothetical protein
MIHVRRGVTCAKLASALNLYLERRSVELLAPLLKSFHVFTIALRLPCVLAFVAPFCLSDCLDLSL